MHGITTEFEKIEEMIEQPTYINPPRAYLFYKLAGLWGSIFVCTIFSVNFLTVLFFIAYIILYVRYLPLFHLWKVYYSKFVLNLLTLTIFGVGMLIAPFIRDILWNFIVTIAHTF